MEEIWKAVRGFEGLYEVSNLGRVKRAPYSIVGRTKGAMRTYPRYFKGGILKGTVCRNGYNRVTLSKDGTNIYKYVHRLVAEAFVPNPHNLPFVNHIDEVRTNNVSTNLEWCTCAYNNVYGDARKRFAEAYSVNHSYAVRALSRTGEVICTFPSVKAAAQTVGVTHSTINRAIAKVRKTAAGFVWEKV